MRIFADNILHDKVVLVTGGGTGIGRGIALGMASYGAHLVLASRHVDHLCAVAHEAQAQGVQALPVRTDVRDPAQVQALIQVALDTFGRIDVLVNNAAGSFLSAARKLTHKGWHSVVDTTLNGTFYCSQAVGRQMIEQGGGKITPLHQDPSTRQARTVTCGPIQPSMIWSSAACLWGVLVLPKISRTWLFSWPLLLVTTSPGRRWWWMVASG